MNVNLLGTEFLRLIHDLNRQFFNKRKIYARIYVLTYIFKIHVRTILNIFRKRLLLKQDNFPFTMVQHTWGDQEVRAPDTSMYDAHGQVSSMLSTQQSTACYDSYNLSTYL